MDKIIDAVFEHGGFRIIDASHLRLSEGQHVRLIVETPPDKPEDLLDLAAQVYEGLSSEQINAIEQIALDRHDFFGNEKRT